MHFKQATLLAKQSAINSHDTLVTTHHTAGSTEAPISKTTRLLLTSFKLSFKYIYFSPTSEHDTTHDFTVLFEQTVETDPRTFLSNLDHTFNTKLVLKEKLINNRSLK